MDAHLLNDLQKVEEYREPPFWEGKARQIFIYGTGRFAQDIQHVLEQKGISVSAFIDHREQKDKTSYSIPVFRPDDLSKVDNRRVDSVILLGIHNREADLLSIIGNLKKLGFNEILPPVVFYDFLVHDLGVRYWLTSRAYYLSHRADIAAVGSLFTDERSQTVFAGLLRFRLTGDYSLLPHPDTEHQYFPDDLPSWPRHLRFVDCGAYHGDTLTSFLRAGYEFEAVAAFEPDLENFHKLSAYISQNQHRFLNTSLFPCGVYSHTTQLTFEIGGGEASKASEMGASRIQCVSLDESIPTFAPHLIKMDIEGAEMDAILGAQRLIKNYQPALAISVYHTPAHLWEIPLRISQLAQENNLQYTYHLRAHAQNCFDTIFYAIPERKTL